MTDKMDIYSERWYVMELCESFYINTDDAKNSGSIAEVLHGKSEEAIKRAVLMSAAPELLKALEDCCQLACGCRIAFCHLEQAMIEDGKCEWQHGCGIWKLIKKARGEKE